MQFSHDGNRERTHHRGVGGVIRVHGGVGPLWGAFATINDLLYFLVTSRGKWDRVGGACIIVETIITGMIVIMIVGSVMQKDEGASTQSGTGGIDHPQTQRHENCRVHGRPWLFLLQYQLCRHATAHGLIRGHHAAGDIGEKVLFLQPLLVGGALRWWR